MKPSLDFSDVQVLEPLPNLTTIPEQQFFALRDKNASWGGEYPLPDSVRCWNHARYKNEDVLYAGAGNHLYFIADDINFGFALFHYVYAGEDGTKCKYFNTLPYRSLQIERRSNKMAMNGMGAAPQLMNLAQQARMQGIPTEQQVPSFAPVSGGNDGVSMTGNTHAIQRTALAQAYVTGYIMGSAPAITLALAKKKVKDSNPTFEIVAKESKPSRCLGVLMALPESCVMKGGNLASPSDIIAGYVDYNVGNTSMVHQYFTQQAAIAYIHALGDSIAEYAPFVSDKNTHWTPADILAGNPNISFVTLRATENKSGSGSTKDRFRFSLKTTSPRRSLFTQHNIVCLRALEHVDVTCKSDADAYTLNEMAFGAWRYRMPKNEKENALQKACHMCPEVIWGKKYTINGEEVDGIGSAFFMSGAEENSAGGTPIMHRELKYYPWWQTGDQKAQTPTVVKKMVKRVLQQADGKRKERMVTIPILFKEKPDDKAFAPYKHFVDFITSEGYIRMDKLQTLGGRSSRGTRKKSTLTPDQLASLTQLLSSEDMQDAIQMVQDAAADDMLLRTTVK